MFIRMLGPVHQSSLWCCRVPRNVPLTSPICEGVSMRTEFSAELEEVKGLLVAMADRMIGKAREVMANPDPVQAAELETDDDVMDELHKGLFVVLLGAAWRHGVEAAIDGALLGRFYERYADHAVNAGHHMYFFVTGEALA